jgi:hypothetical protein
MNELKYLLVFFIIFVIYKLIYNYHNNETFTPSGNIINVMITQSDGRIIPTPCIGTLCRINCNITYTPSGSCVLISK